MPNQPAAGALAGPAAAAELATWAELASAALLGSDRWSRTGSRAEARVEARAGSGAGSPGHEDLLSVAAVLAVARQAGARPAAAANLPSLTRPGPMPEDSRPLITPAAAQRLRVLLDGYQKYLPEWLSAARASGCRIPPVFFPELLDLTRNNTQIRADLTALLGEPGRWLAALNKNWAFFLGEPAENGAQPRAQSVQSGAQSLTRPAPQSRVPAPPAADFTAEARRLLSRPKNSNDLYNLVMRQPGLWPEEGSRLLIEYVAVHRYTVVTKANATIDGGQPTARSSDWAIEQLQRTIGDHAPTHLRTLVSDLIEEQEQLGAGSANPVVDLREILDALTFRAEMHGELTAGLTARISNDQHSHAAHRHRSSTPADLEGSSR